jgi:NADH:ubiquinone oxidoreductase subunit H
VYSVPFISCLVGMVVMLARYGHIVEPGWKIIVPTCLAMLGTVVFGCVVCVHLISWHVKRDYRRRYGR